MKKKKTKLDEIASELRQQITGGFLKVDTHLPTESELAHKFGCSRGTVGKALDRLVQQGLVVRKTRIGTRVVSQTPKATVPSLHAYGFIHPSEQHEQIWETIRGFSEAAEAVGRRTIAISYNNDQEQEFEILGHLGDHMLEGVAIYPIVESPNMAIKLIEASERSTIPLTFVCLTAGGIECPTVLVDGFDSGLTVTTSLIEKGAKRIGFLGNNGWTLSSRDRLQGFRRALQQANFPWKEDYVQVDYPTRANFTEPTQEGYELGKVFIDSHPELDAIICSDAFLAYGALQAVRESGRSVPEDFRIGALDYNSACEKPDACMTAYRIDFRELGRCTFRTLDALTQDKTKAHSAREVFQSGELVECGVTELV